MRQWRMSALSHFYRIGLLAAIITMRLLILKILCGDKSLTPIFYFLCKAKVCIYYSFYLPFLLSKKTLSCSLCLIKLLILCMLRLKILFLRLLFSLVVSYSIT